jgi:signal transduction histidine kinase
MTFRRKLQLGFLLMVIPALLVGAEAIRSTYAQRRALEELGASMARTRIYAELETAMFNQSEIVWRYLSGMDPSARKEFDVTGEVIAYWQQRWRGVLAPNERGLADSVQEIQSEIHGVALHVFSLYDSGQREAAYVLARDRLRDGLLPQLTALNRYIYRRARESPVQGAYSRLEQILRTESRLLLAIVVLALAAGLVGSWLIAEGLARPITELRTAMAVVGAGNLDHPINTQPSGEVGDLARAFATMTDKLRQSRADLVRLNTELEAKVEQLQQTQTQLVQSERMASIGQTAAAVAHGLRNPLASLRAVAQLALRHPGSPAAQENLGEMIGEVDRLDRRITHFLDFSRPAPFHPLRENASQLLDGLLPPLRKLTAERSVALDVSLAPVLPDTQMDPMQIEQALLEVISNALDSMPGGGRLRLATRVDATETPDEVVVIEVADTGAGIPADTLASVCEPFFTTRADGTGLGLAIAKRYVEQNGGTLSIMSRTNEGTTVRMTFPALSSEDRARDVAANAEPADVAGHATRRT